MGYVTSKVGSVKKVPPIITVGAHSEDSANVNINNSDDKNLFDTPNLTSDITCSIERCRTVLGSLEEVIYHLQTTHKTVSDSLPAIYSCQPCKSSFKSKQSLFGHNQEHHTRTKCTICEQSFDIIKEEKFYRLLLQSKWINSHCELQSVHLPSLEDIVQVCARPNVIYGSLDFTNFYWQIGCTERYSKLYNMVSPIANHAPLRCMQGDASSPFSAMVA